MAQATDNEGAGKNDRAEEEGARKNYRAQEEARPAQIRLPTLPLVRNGRGCGGRTLLSGRQR